MYPAVEILCTSDFCSSGNYSQDFYEHATQLFILLLVVKGAEWMAEHKVKTQFETSLQLRIMSHNEALLSWSRFDRREWMTDAQIQSAHHSLFYFTVTTLRLPTKPFLNIFITFLFVYTANLKCDVSATDYAWR